MSQYKLRIRVIKISVSQKDLNIQICLIKGKKIKNIKSGFY